MRIKGVGLIENVNNSVAVDAPSRLVYLSNKQIIVTKYEYTYTYIHKYIYQVSHLACFYGVIVLQAQALTWSYLAKPKSCFVVQTPVQTPGVHLS